MVRNILKKSLHLCWSVNMRPEKSRRAVSLVELLVAAAITVGLAGGIFSVLHSARSAAELSRAREEAKQMAEMALHSLQKDIMISQATIDKKTLVGEGDNQKPSATLSFQGGGGSWTMKIPKDENSTAMASEYVDVSYSLSGRNLMRSGGVEGKTKLVAGYISKLEIFALSQDQVSIEIETEVKPSGEKNPVKHNQKALVTIREAVTVNVDDRWRTSDEVITEY